MDVTDQFSPLVSDFRALLARVTGLASGADASGVVREFEAMLPRIVELIQATSRDADASDARTGLRHLRHALAETLLNMPDDRLQAYFTAGLGKAHSLLARPEIKLDPPLEQELPTVRQLASCVDKSAPLKLTDANGPRLLLAGMLYYRPDELAVPFDLPNVPLWMINEYLRFMHEPPQLFARVGEADAYADFVDRWVEYVHANVMDNPAVDFWKQVGLFFAQAGNYIAYYFNYRNLKETYHRRAQVMETALKSFGNPVDYIFPPRDRNRPKLRLGILSAHFNPQTETFATLPFYKHLNREIFEIILIGVHQSGHRLERYCSGHADAYLVPQGQLPQQVQAIRQADLDMVLIATNVTAVSNAITFLAAHRLARVQINSVCSCVTSGMSNNDYYVSGRTTELPENPQQHYTETLRLVDGPAHCCDFGTEENSLPTQRPTRAELGIPDDAVVFMSGSNFYKVIPEVEQVWMDVLARVPNSRLLLYPFNPNWSNAYPSGAFVRRLHASMQQRGIDASRLTVFPAVAGRGDILERLKLADLYLDSFPFSGITSLIDPLEMAVPPVVMEGNSFRSLMAPALMRELNLPQLIAPNPAAYVDLAVKLAEDLHLRKDLARQIREGMQRRPKFQDSRWYSRQVQDILLAIAKEKGLEIPMLAGR